MKKTLIFALLMVLFISCPGSVLAAESEHITSTDGYTSDGVYFKVHEQVYVNSDNSISVTRTVTYDGNIIPPRQVSFQEVINNITYAGTLNLIQLEYDPKANQTIATYKGTLTAQ